MILISWRKLLRVSTERKCAAVMVIFEKAMIQMQEESPGQVGSGVVLPPEEA